MVSREIVKVTSKGQLTLPAEMRRSLNLDKDSYLYVERLGNLIVMKKVGELTLDEISAILQRAADEKGLTKRDLEREVERVRSERWRSRLQA